MLLPRGTDAALRLLNVYTVSAFLCFVFKKQVCLVSFLRFQAVKLSSMH